MRAWWYARDLLADSDLATHERLLTAALGLRLLRIPAAVCSLARVRRAPLDLIPSSDVFATLQDVWRGHALSALQTIWRWRHGAMDAVNSWDDQRALLSLRAHQRSIVQTLNDDLYDSPLTPSTRLLQDLLLAMTVAPISTTSSSFADDSSSAERYVLVFDGGSRGNPGSGGSGAVVVRMSADALSYALVWSTVVHHGDPTITNNTAEYEGLIAGLTATSTHRWVPLEVVGDSQLVLRQLSAYRSPLNARLHTLYERARRLSDHLDVQWWHHHYRASNRGADAAANLAMDSRATLSTQHPTSEPAWTAVRQHISTDFAQWQSTFLSRT